jgi:aromatic-L-amino-acid/L-tryptophan decarboxylase
VGTTVGAFADMIAAAMSPNTWGGDQAAALVEAQVLRWFAPLLGFPEDAAGLLVSGGSVANLVALAAARERHGGDNVYAQGVAQRQLTLYASAEVHNSVDKAAATLGIGANNLRRIPCTSDYTMKPEALRAALGEDVAAGRTPVAVVATAGTVNTGAFDPIDEIADICAEHNVWLHVDGAFGAMVALTARYAQLARGMGRADSIAFDFHKWLHIPVDCGCVFTRSGDEQRRAFSPPAHYLARLERGVTAGDLDFSSRGLQLTRSFRALKVWMTLQTYGIETMGKLVEQNIAQARYLADLVERHDHLELLAPVPLNVVCFRYTQPGLDDEALNALNREILMRLQESGTAVVSSTVLQGRFALRACICNHRTRTEDLDMLVDAVVSSRPHPAESAENGAETL